MEESDMYMPVVEAAKNRAKDVTGKVRSQMSMQTGFNGAASIGNGQLINKAKAKVASIRGTGATSSQVIVTQPIRPTGAVLNAQHGPNQYVRETIAISQ
jgi:hypothetical protein